MVVLLTVAINGNGDGKRSEREREIILLRLLRDRKCGWGKIDPFKIQVFVGFIHASVENSNCCSRKFIILRILRGVLINGGKIFNLEQYKILMKFKKIFFKLLSNLFPNWKLKNIFNKIFPKKTFNFQVSLKSLANDVICFSDFFFSPLLFSIPPSRSKLPLIIFILTFFSRS